MNGNYYSAGSNADGACTVKDKSESILSMTPITCFKENNLKIAQVFVSFMGFAPFWETDDGSIYTSCQYNLRGRVGVEVDRNKPINKIPFLSQLSIKKMCIRQDMEVAKEAMVWEKKAKQTNHGNELKVSKTLLIAILVMNLSFSYLLQVKYSVLDAMTKGNWD
eukprot:236197_1